MTQDGPASSLPDPDAEWLEADDLGGFASGTAGGIRTRRYHALLLAATTPPTGRVVLVNGLEAWIEAEGFRVALSSQRYASGVVVPDGIDRLAGFSALPWPTWTWAMPGGDRITHEIVVEPASGETVLRWRRAAGTGPCRLVVRLLVSGRDYGAMHRENPAFRFDATIVGGNVGWRPYPDLPAIAALSNGTYTHAPDWYRGFLYTKERERGLECLEDLATPGLFAFDLAAGDAILILRTGDGLLVEPVAHAATLLAAEAARRAGLPGRLARAARSYRVARGTGETLIAGFPWFTDWGRDTFIALRGLLLGTGDRDGAAAILGAWAGQVDGGMLPNRFPDRGETPEFNAVDASLWFVVATHDYLSACEAAGQPSPLEPRLRDAALSILAGYRDGVRFGIRAAPDGLLAAGEPGVQLTWMDAKTGDHVVTPRIGKPVEVQALWINALAIAARRWDPAWGAAETQARAAFLARFPHPAGGLYDVVDADHVPGRLDASLRPNQIFAVGGLPFGLLSGPAARAVVDRVEAALLTPLGLRTLVPDDPAYRGRYAGDLVARDGAYHQGTAWPWLLGPFVEAWLRVRGDDAAARAEARDRFLPPLLAHLDQDGLGHVCEVVDGDAPHRPGGCPFQAWSLGEFIRICRMVDAPDPVAGD